MRTALLLLLLSNAAVAGAQDGATQTTEDEESNANADDERAQIHFMAARDAFNSARYEEALASFERAYELSQRPALLYNLYLCEERLGHYGRAANYLERFVQDNPDESLDDYSERIANLRARAARESSDAPEPPDAQPAVEEAPRNALLVPALVSFGVGAAGAITFAVFGGLALSRDGDFSAGCLRDGSCSESELDTQDTFTTLADVGWITGLAGVAAGTVLWIVGSKSDDAASVAVVPFSNQDATGLVATGVF